MAQHDTIKEIVQAAGYCSKLAEEIGKLAFAMQASTELSTVFQDPDEKRYLASLPAIVKVKVMAGYDGLRKAANEFLAAADAIRGTQAGQPGGE